ncbi:MAG: hypothetical protein ABJC12_07305 [Saprospiraceae bacterium]
MQYPINSIVIDKFIANYPVKTALRFDDPVLSIYCLGQLSDDDILTIDISSGGQIINFDMLEGGIIFLINIIKYKIINNNSLLNMDSFDFHLSTPLIKIISEHKSGYYKLINAEISIIKYLNAFTISFKPVQFASCFWYKMDGLYIGFEGNILIGFIYEFSLNDIHLIEANLFKTENK